MKYFIKSNKYLLLVALILLILVIGITIFQKSYAFSGASGTSGTCNWTIDTNGKMIIEPSSGNSCTLGAAQNNAMPWYANRADILSVEVKPGVKANVNSNSLFSSLTKATAIDVSNLDTTGVTNMTSMFRDNWSLTSLDVTNFNTSSVTVMSYMFGGCAKLSSLDLSKFDTSMVTSMECMFLNCHSLTSLDLSKFNTTSVTSMREMFLRCSSLTSLDLSSFDTSNVTSVGSIFATTAEEGSDIGSNAPIGTKLILSNKFYRTAVAHAYGYPYGDYAKEENGILSNKLYTLSEMQAEVTSSTSPTTWVPAYKVNYNGNGGTFGTDSTLDKTYRIGSKIDTSGINPKKPSFVIDKWNNVIDGTGNLTINKNGTSANSYGDNYTSVGTNNVLTLYAQYVAGGNHTITYKTDSKGTLDKTSEEVEDNSNPVGVTSTPNTNYKVVSSLCDKNVTLNDGTVINKGKPIKLEQIKLIKVTDDLTFTIYHRNDIVNTFKCN